MGQQRRGFYVKCVGDGTLIHPAPHVWKTSVIYVSGVGFCFHILHQNTPAKLGVLLLLVSIIIYFGGNV